MRVAPDPTVPSGRLHEPLLAPNARLRTRVVPRRLAAEVRNAPGQGAALTGTTRERARTRHDDNVLPPRTMTPATSEWRIQP